MLIIIFLRSKFFWELDETRRKTQWREVFFTGFVSGEIECREMCINGWNLIIILYGYFTDKLRAFCEKGFGWSKKQIEEENWNSPRRGDIKRLKFPKLFP